ncbi:MAG: DNA polymerase III subunit epsilon [Alphaproteobacteria bacterium]|nr:MAG: DNA polymerase III subunit epsilon [Alphaproteobacteria bacterium]
MREIVLDTETTGFEPAEGHRLVEIGCVELMHQIPTGNTYHVYINPEREMPEEAYRVHGLSDEFLADKPVFADVADAFLEFIGDAPLVIHNAAFDMNFLNAELGWAKKTLLPMEQAVDTLMMAREKYPGAAATLDALCRRFEIDNSNRTLHGALLDAELLAEVYLELMGGRQHGLGFSGTGDVQDSEKENDGSVAGLQQRREARAARDFPIPAAELEAHRELVEKIENALWRQTPKNAAEA